MSCIFRLLRKLFYVFSDYLSSQNKKKEKKTRFSEKVAEKSRSQSIISPPPKRQEKTCRLMPLPKIKRIKREKDFERIFKTGRAFKHPLFLLKISKNDFSYCR